MRIAIVTVFQVSNTFNRRFCDLDRFEVLDTLGQGSNSVPKVTNVHLFTSMIQAASDENVTKVPIFSAVAPPSGRVTNAAVNTIVSELRNFLDSSVGSIDVVAVILSGTMITEDWKSGDAEVLHAVRRSVGPDLPVLALWSGQANLSTEVFNLAELNFGVDLTDVEHFERNARKTVDLAARLIRHQARPNWELQNLPLLIPVTAQRTFNSPLNAIRELATEFEGYDGVLDVTVFSGFPYADTETTGCSVLVTVAGDQEKAENLAIRLRTAIWSEREAFVEQLPNVETAVHEAMLAEGQTTVMADAGDDPGAGAAGEGTGLLWALVDLGAHDATLALIVDTHVVEAGIRAGVGSDITIDLGGAHDRSAGYPIEVTGRVRRISDGQITLDRGETVELGRAIVLSVTGRHGGEVEVIVSEIGVEPFDPEIFSALGVDLSRKQIIALKTSSHYREAFAAHASRFVTTTTPGITTPVFAHFDYRRLRRPIFPLDRM